MKYSEIVKLGTEVPSQDDLILGGFALDIRGKALYSKDENGDVFMIGQTFQPDWNITDANNPAYIKNKPTIVKANWNESDSNNPAYIQNKPSIPSPVQSDWNVTDSSNIAHIKNKPTLDYFKGEWVEVWDGNELLVENTWGGGVFLLESGSDLFIFPIKDENVDSYRTDQFTLYSRSIDPVSIGYMYHVLSYDAGTKMFSLKRKSNNIDLTNVTIDDGDIDIHIGSIYKLK